MSSQEQIAKEKAKKEEVAKEFKGKFELIQSTPATKMVKLITQSCCGCGCSDIWIQREVPYDSNLKNGDRVDCLKKGDKTL